MMSATELNCRHWQVISPEMVEFSQWESPETFRCFEIFEADSARHALVLAVKSEEFKPWVKEARGDGVPPFKGLKATRCVCEHGVCWGCVDQCDTCVAEYEDEG